MQIIAPQKNIREVLEQYGYPFKSKEHSCKLFEYQKGNRPESIKKYFRLQESNYRTCPNILMYQTTPEFKLKVSDLCCHKLKKDVAKKYQLNNNKAIGITGMTREEGGQRTTLNCIVSDKEGKIKKFHPLAIITEDFINWYIAERRIELCELYYPPYNFKRTGCKGCPFNLDLQDQLDIMAVLLPAEKKQCEIIWKPVYEEYRRIGYRLRKENQPSLFE
ncbi:MAG: phosphoadenosine phosphosulfate reductase family protein [Methanobrevibacter sp.]|nr:phosphoadenosine phosphosulfate reductase family protein [Methanobrevibacter sp.]